jgi:hypothetical protein
MELGQKPSTHFTARSQPRNVHKLFYLSARNCFCQDKSVLSLPHRRLQRRYHLSYLQISDGDAVSPESARVMRVLQSSFVS